MMGRSLGIFLYHLRRKLHVSQEELARRAGVSPVQLGKIERGEIDRPHHRTWELIARGLGVSVDEMERRAAAVARLEGLISSEILEMLRLREGAARTPEGEALAEEYQVFGDFDLEI